MRAPRGFHTTYTLLGAWDSTFWRVHVLADGGAVSENTRGPDCRASIAATLRSWRLRVAARPGQYRIVRSRTMAVRP